MSHKHRLLTFTVMKNEGPFILEWVAYQRVFGASDILVLTNNCDDGTDLICERLDRMGVIHHAPNPCVLGADNIRMARHPHILGMEFAKHFTCWQQADYILMCDADEFPDIYVGDGTFDALMEHTGSPDVISLSEKMFGAYKHVEFDERLLMERFTRCSSETPGRWRARKGIKSIVRNDPRIDVRNHRPLVAADVAPTLNWIDGGGQPFPEEARTEHLKGLDVRGRYTLGAINHYVLRSMESFLVKVARGDAVAQYENRLDWIYFKRRNRFDDENTHIQRLMPALIEERDRLMRDPELAEAHWAAVRHHRNKIIELRQIPAFAELFEQMVENMPLTRDEKRAQKAEADRHARAVAEGRVAPSEDA